MRKFLFGALLLIAVVLVGGYFLISRGPTTYAALDKTYANAASKFIDMGDGVSVHYRDEGNASGRTLLLVHGFSASLHTWEPWVAALGGEYHVVSLDLPGHGLTRAPEGYAPGAHGYVDLVDAFAEKLHLGKVVIVGSSMGGGVAWQLALRHPERVEGLVLVDAAGWPEPQTGNDKGPQIFKLLRNPVIGPLLRRIDNTPMVKQGLQASFANPALVTDAMVARYVDMSRAPGHGEVLLSLMTARDQRVVATEELLAGIKVPTLILHGRQDNLIPVESATKFNDAIAGSRLIVYDNVGHVPQEELPVRSADDVRNFLHAAFPEPAAGVALATSLP